MADYKVVQFRRGNTTQNSIFTGAQGEISVNTDTWTAIVHDGVTPGGYPLKQAGALIERPHYVTFRVANVQNGIATLALTTGNNPPVATVIQESSGLILGAASFSYEQGQNVQGHFALPSDWVAPINLEVVWRTSALTGSAQWGVQGLCLSSTTVLESATFNPVVSAVSPPVGITANAIQIMTIPNIDTTGFVANGEVFFQFSRLAADSLMGDAELLALRFVLLLKDQ